MRSSAVLLVVALSLACVCLSSAEVDVSPRAILHRIASGGLLGPSAQMEMKRAIRRLTPEQKQQLRKEADAAQAAHMHARRHPAPQSSKRSPAAGPDFSSIPSVLNPFMQCRGITGLSVGIVQGGKLVYSSGFGVQDQTGTPVDADTLFGVGSVTKSFTAGLAAMAQQDGVFDFDANYRDYLPGFEMNDGPSSSLLSTRDLLTHRTGVASHDTALFLNTVPDPDGRRKKVFDFKYLPSADVPVRFRTRFCYSNWQVTAAGYMLGEMAQASPDGDWESAVRQRIFKPLGMQRTCANFTQCESAPNRATPMQWDPTTKTFVDFPYNYNYVINQAAPCGAIVSTANELALWANVHLGHYPELLSPASLYELHSPSMTWSSAEPLVPNWLYLRAHGYAYGMNFWIGDYNGEKLVWHQGDVWGFRALVAFLPESDIGVVLLSNSDSADSIAPNQMWWRSIIEFYLFDLVQQNPNPTFPNGAADMCNFPCNILPSLCPDAAAAPLSSLGDRSDAEIDDAEIVEAEDTLFLSSADKRAASTARAASAAASRKSNGNIPLNLSDYLGVFRQEAYGNVSIAWSNSTESSLTLTMGNFIDMPPTATELVFQSNGGSDRFAWPIGDEEAQTLSNSYVDFQRDSVNGGVVSWMLFSAVDDDGLQINILFDRIADAEGNPVAKARASPMVARSHASRPAAAAAVPLPAASTPLADALHEQLELVQTQAEHRRLHAHAKLGQLAEPLASDASAASHGPLPAEQLLRPEPVIALVGVLALLLLASVVFCSWRSSKEIAALRVAIQQQQPVQRA